MPIYQSYFNPFGTDILLTEKPRGWFPPAEAENSNRRKTFEIKMQMERQRKSSSSSVICQLFASKSVIWFLCKWITKCIGCFKTKHKCKYKQQILLNIFIRVTHDLVFIALLVQQYWIRTNLIFFSWFCDIKQSQEILNNRNATWVSKCGKYRNYNVTLIFLGRALDLSVIDLLDIDLSGIEFDLLETDIDSFSVNSFLIFKMSSA